MRSFSMLCALAIAIVASAAQQAQAVVLSTDILGAGIFNNGYSNANGVEIVRNVPSGDGTNIYYTAGTNPGDPTLNILNYTPLNFTAGGLGSNIHGRGSVMYLPGDGETPSSNNGGIGIGAHATFLITFDLDQIRADHFTTGQNLTLTGRFGQNGQGASGEIVDPLGLSQGLIYVDGQLVFASNLKGTGDLSDAISQFVGGSAQYMTLVIASGDGSNYFDDGTFRDLVFAEAVPEPSTIGLMGVGLAGLILARKRRVAAKG